MSLSVTAPTFANELVHIQASSRDNQIVGCTTPFLIDLTEADHSAGWESPTRSQSLETPRATDDTSHTRLSQKDDSNMGSNPIIVEDFSEVENCRDFGGTKIPTRITNRSEIDKPISTSEPRVEPVMSYRDAVIQKTQHEKMSFARIYREIGRPPSPQTSNVDLGGSSSYNKHVRIERDPTPARDADEVYNEADFLVHVKRHRRKNAFI